MNSYFKAVKVSENVYWVGAIDWELRDFHGYATPRGSTYNAYLILADKVTLIDTVKSNYKDELLGRISSIIDPTKIDYIISNHAEMDHSGCLPEIMDLVKPEKVFASTKGVAALDKHFGIGDRLEKAKKNEELDLGNMKLTFMETPMIHWPDSMFTYLDSDKVLFSNDSFGMHLASSERFDDQLDMGLMNQEASKYYCNILMPMSAQISKLLKNVGGIGEIDIIAPDHGPVWRENVPTILDWYEEWSNLKKQKKAVIAYDTMWGSTAKLGRAIAEGLMSEGISVKIMPIQQNDRSEIAREVLDASAFILGSPTLNNGLFPTVADLMTYIEGLKPKTPFGAAFGSYGWSDKASKKIEEWIGTTMKMEIVDAGVSSNYIPDEDNFKASFDLGKKIGETINDSLK
jgi:flavorubredoxin